MILVEAFNFLKKEEYIIIIYVINRSLKRKYNYLNNLSKTHFNWLQRHGLVVKK